MGDSLRLLKYRAKQNPLYFLKRPWLMFFLPFWGAQFILGRLKSCTSVVYLTETSIEELLAKSRARTESLRWRVVRDSAEFAVYARERVEEDRAVGRLYFEEVDRRFARGDFAVVGFVDDCCPVAYVFICTARAVFTPVNMTLPLPRATFGLYDVYTYEKFRGRGYYSSLFDQSVRMMLHRDFEKVWLWLMVHNQGSIRVHLAIGINLISKILTEKISFGIIKRTVTDVNISLDNLISK